MGTFTSYDGTELTYHTTGEGEPLICLPGGPLRASSYLGDLGGLAAHRQLVALDLRGTGASAAPADPATYRCDRHVADVEALRAHLGLERMDLLGHSASGNLAALYAAAHPARVSSLVLVTPGVRAVGIEITDEEWDEAATVHADQEWYPHVRAALGALPEDASAREVMAAAAPLAYGRWDDAARAHAQAGDAETNWDALPAFHGEGAYAPDATRAALAGFTAPVLVLAGSHDSGPTPRRAAELAALFPAGELVVQAGAGHYPWVDDPGAFARAVAAFLDPEVSTVTAPDGTRLAYRTWGEETAPPLVLVHGRCGSSREWAEVAADLATTHRVYALDLRGHGLSDWPGTYSFEVFRDDVRALFTALDLRGADLIGHSMGGVAALLLAQDAPELVGRLVNEEGTAFFPLDPPRGPVERPDEPLDFDWSLVPAVNAQLNAPDPAWREGVKTLAAPTLVVAGGSQSPFSQEQLAWLAEQAPDGRLVTVEAGHLVHAGRPDEFLAVVREFLEA
ncbi:alpha/beta fold hydrolase [Streptomyces sp. NPDC050504]|uniref:alpha/beta fold hydrolase n=1 Tax=Streptomyces sp. NPDC050504 TaxID=3365618 RepID=UPI00379EB2D5